MGPDAAEKGEHFMDEKNNGAPNLPRDQYEPVLNQAMDMELLNAGITVSAFDVSKNHVFKTCYGDVRKIVDALRDYSKLLEMACVTWELQGYQKAVYELRAQKLREIAGKLQAGIGYDYDAAMARCEKQKAKKRRDDDVGGEALAMGLLRARQMAEAKDRKAAENENRGKASASGEVTEDAPWEEDL